jgi:hypothetical protein
MVYFMLTRGEEFVDQGQQRYEEEQHAGKAGRENSAFNSYPTDC